MRHRQHHDDDRPQHRPQASVGRVLAAAVTAYAIVQHSGTAFSWLGELPMAGAAGQTRWADWIDLVTPHPLLGLLAWALCSVAAARRAWVGFFIGAVTYCVGHGVHLAANSVGNVAPGDVAHLWDEAVGHYVTHSGVAVLVIAVAAAVRGQRVWPIWATIPAGLAVGITHGTNALEGGTAVFGLTVAVALFGWGLRRRDSVGWVLVGGYGAAALLIAGYGMWQGGFPQPSQVGIGG